MGKSTSFAHDVVAKMFSRGSPLGVLVVAGQPWVFYMKNNLFTREDAPQHESTIDMQSFPTAR